MIDDKDLNKIPYGPYCYDRDHRCQFFTFKTLGKPEFEKAYPGEQFLELTLEYCNYLKEYLDIQDSIKDCDINTDN